MRNVTTEKSGRALAIILVLGCACLAGEPALASGFLSPATYLAGRFPGWVAVVDVNSDGHPDIIAQNTSGVSVLLNNGDGTFGTATTFPVSGTTLFLTTADVNTDGNPDVILLGTNGNRVDILLGNGDGTLQPALSIPAPTQPTGIIVGDFNGDGDPDLGVTNFLDTQSLSIFSGNGDGTFQTPVNYQVGPGNIFVDVGDFNNDGILDLVLVNDVSNTVSIWLGKGDGTFQQFASEDVGMDPVFAAVGDLNRDGILDLVVANTQGDDLSILLGNGDGSFQPAVSLPLAIEASPREVLIEDINQDTKADLAVLTQTTDDARIFLGIGDGTFHVPQNFNLGNTPSAMAIGDVNGDGSADLIANNGDPTYVVAVLAGNGDGSFRTAREYNTGFGASEVAVGDFNGDRKLDVVSVNVFDVPADISVLLGKGDGTMLPAANSSPGGSFISTADLNQDGKLDLVLADGSIIVRLGNGDGTFQGPVNFPADHATSFAIGDLNRDGKLDVVTANPGGDSDISVLFGNGDGTFQSGTNYKVGFLSQHVTLGDFNQDGILDIAVSGDPGILMLLGNGDGTFHTGAISMAGLGPGVIGDFNHDGKLDLAVTDTSVPFAVDVLLGNGDGTFQAEAKYLLGSQQPFAVTVVDVNGDGKQDLAVAVAGVGVLLGKGDGTFLPLVVYPCGQPLWLATADLNQDRAPDLVIAGPQTTITVLLNTGGAKVTTTSSANPSHLGQAVTFTATVAPTFSFIGTPTGTITFKDGTSTLGKVALTGGQASLTTSTLALGKHKITAVYSGDANFNPNQSATLRQRVIH